MARKQWSKFVLVCVLCAGLAFLAAWLIGR